MACDYSAAITRHQKGHSFVCVAPSLISAPGFAVTARSIAVVWKQEEESAASFDLKNQNPKPDAESMFQMSIYHSLDILE